MEIFKSEIRVFQEVVKAGSLSKASEKLNLNQPAISKSILRLEKDLKVKLFVRSREGIKLTQKGVDLLNYVKNCETKLQPQVEMDRLRIGCHQSIALGSLPELVPRLKKAFPGLELVFEFLPSLEVTRRVASLDLDLGIVINPLKRQQLIFKTLGKDYVAIWQGKRSQSKPSLTLIHPDMFLAAKVQSGMEVLQVPDYEVISHMVTANSEYCAVLPAVIARRHGLKPLNDKKLFEVNLNLIMHEDRFSKEMRKSLMDLFI